MYILHILICIRRIYVHILIYIWLTCILMTKIPAHKLPGSPMGHVPMTSGHDRSLVLCVSDPVCWKSTPVLQSNRRSSQHRDRTRTIVFWAPRRTVTPSTANTRNIHPETRKHTGGYMWRWPPQRTVVGIPPHETMKTIHALGEDRSGGKILRKTICLGPGDGRSRPCSVESYIVRTQTRVQRDIIKETSLRWCHGKRPMLRMSKREVPKEEDERGWTKDTEG